MTLSKEWTIWLAIFAAVGSAAMGGLLFAFSSFVMRALAQQPAESAVRTMQAINVLIINPLFMIIFMGTTLASLILGGVSVAQFSHSGAIMLLFGSVLYVVGVAGITMGFNVPLNNQLAALSPSAIEATQYWPVYLNQWLRWNHIRTVAAFVAVASLIVAIWQWRDLV